MQISYPNDEKSAFAAVYNLSNYTCILVAKVALLAHNMRAEAAVQDRHDFDSQVIASRQRLIAQVRAEFYDLWDKEYPSFLPRNSPHAGMHLPLLARLVFEFVGYSHILLSLSNIHANVSF